MKRKGRVGQGDEEERQGRTRRGRGEARGRFFFLKLPYTELIVKIKKD